MKRFQVLLIFFGLLILPSMTSAQNVTFKAGMELYSKIKLIDDSTMQDDLEKYSSYLNMMGYLNGFLDGLSLTQNLIYETVLPSGTLTESERDNLAKQINLKRISIPKTGITALQIAMIFKKWAENNPKDLNNTARGCLMSSITEAYGFK
jgi:hypothetical protein